MEGKYSNIFHEDMYPTPSKVLDLMQIDCVGHTVLEPSAGKGNIITYLKFKDEKIWEKLNRAYAKIKGEVLPEKF